MEQLMLNGPEDIKPIFRDDAQEHEQDLLIIFAGKVLMV